MKLFKRALPEQPVLFSGEAYRDCADLPLWNWIEVTVTKDLKYLVKTGNVASAELLDIWTAINDEYRTLMRDLDNNYGFELRKEIAVADQDLLTITAVVNQLRIRRNEELISILQNNFNFRLKYVDLNTDLDRTLRQWENRLVQLRLKEKELSDLKSTEAPKEITRFDMIEQLRVLSEFQGYHIKMKEVSVAEYIAVYNAFKMDVEIKLARNGN